MSRVRSKSPKVMKLLETIRIGPKTMSLCGDRDMRAGSGKGSLYGSNGQGEIRVSIEDGWEYPHEILDTLFHEIIEMILVKDCKGYRDRYGKVVFNFDHDYLDVLCEKFIDSIISCGAFELPDRIKFKKVQGDGKVRAGDGEDSYGEEDNG